MNILVDIGNTTIAVALYKDEKFVKKIIVSTLVDKVEDEYFLLLHTMLNKYISEKVEHILISSVVPKVTRTIKAVLKRLFNIEPKVFGVGYKTGAMIKIDNPSELGSDLVCDVVGGLHLYQEPMIIVDLGTASKILVIDNTKAFIGCVIAPGILTSASTLIDKTSLLPETDLVLPKNLIGKNTSDSLKAGMVVGHAEMIKGLCYQIEKQLGYPCKRILTGGNSFPVKDYLTRIGFQFSENLLFDGLKVILDKNI